MRDLFNSKNVVILTLLALICFFMLHFFRSKKGIIINNNYKSIEYSDDDFLSDNDPILNHEMDDFQPALDMPYDINKDRTVA